MRINSASAVTPPRPPSWTDSSRSNLPGFDAKATESFGSLLDNQIQASGLAQSSESSPMQWIAGEIRGVNELQRSADARVHDLLTGGDVNEAEVLTSVQKADLAFRMLLQVRNKLIEAYREIQQIQI